MENRHEMSEIPDIRGDWAVSASPPYATPHSLSPPLSQYGTRTESLYDMYDVPPAPALFPLDLSSSLPPQVSHHYLGHPYVTPFSSSHPTPIRQRSSAPALRSSTTPSHPMMPSGSPFHSGLSRPPGHSGADATEPGGPDELAEPPEGQHLAVKGPKKATEAITGLTAKGGIIHPMDADGKYPCPHCSKTYLHTKHLKRHLFRHTGDRPYRCDLCQDTFTRSDIRNRHFQKCSLRHGKPIGTSNSLQTRKKLVKSDRSQNEPPFEPGSMRRPSSAWTNDEVDEGPSETTSVLEGVLCSADDDPESASNQQLMASLKRRSSGSDRQNRSGVGPGLSRSNPALFDGGYHAPVTLAGSSELDPLAMSSLDTHVQEHYPSSLVYTNHLGELGSLGSGFDPLPASVSQARTNPPELLQVSCGHEGHHLDWMENPPPEDFHHATFAHSDLPSHMTTTTAGHIPFHHHHHHHHHHHPDHSYSHSGGGPYERTFLDSNDSHHLHRSWSITNLPIPIELSSHPPALGIFSSSSSYAEREGKEKI